MSRRRVRQLAWVGIGLCLVTLGLGVTMRNLSTLSGVTEANVERVQEGMTMREVEALFGGPGEFLGKGRRWTGAWVTYAWHAGRASALVHFDERGRALSAQLFERTEEPGISSLARLRAWLAGLAGNLPHDVGNLK
jgi:hypothetical protein